MQGDEVLKKAGKKTHSKRLSCQSSEGRDAVPREGGVYNVPGGSCLFGELLRAVGRNPRLRNRKGAQRWVWGSLWELEVTGHGQGGGGRSKEAALLRTGREEGKGRGQTGECHIPDVLFVGRTPPRLPTTGGQGDKPRS